LLHIISLIQLGRATAHVGGSDLQAGRREWKPNAS
jgi:hypothetical protein